MTIEGKVNLKTRKTNETLSCIEYILSNERLVGVLASWYHLRVGFAMGL